MKNFLKKCFKYFAAAGLFSFFINTLYLTFSLYMLLVYDRVLAEYRMSTLAVITVIALVSLFSLGLLEFIRSGILIKAGVKMDELLTRKVIKAMLSELSALDSEGYNQGLGDINAVRNYLAGNSIFAFFDIPWIFIYLWIVFLVHPVLGWTATAGAVFIFILGLIQYFISKKDVEDQNLFKKYGMNYLAKSLNSSHVLQSMGMVRNSFSFFKVIDNGHVMSHKKFTLKNHSLGAVSVSFRSMMQVIIYGVGASLVIKNEAGTGLIIAASIIMGRALAPIDQAIGAWKQTSSVINSFKNLDKLLSGYKPGREVDPKALKGRLDVKNLCLSIKESKILEDISFSLNEGEILGLAGHNGAGKTCLSRLLLGIWKPSEGSVALNNIEISEISQDILGKNIGYLPQDVELFHGTVGENIARLGVVDSQMVIDAAIISGSHELFLKFPQGYETNIGESGAALSGGQRQRVGLARAFYGLPGFMILDEPNSNLDIEGEKALINALKNIKKIKSTAIIITHKPEILYHADKILILEKGKIKLFGPKEEVFRSMVNLDSSLSKMPDSANSKNSSADNESGGL